MSTVTFPSEMTKAQCLLALWDATNSLGLGRLHSHNSPTLEQAQENLNKGGGVDYFFGKPIKTNFDNFPVLSNWGYDRDAGSGKMQEVADGLAESIGPSKRLNKCERKRVINQANESIQVVNRGSSEPESKTHSASDTGVLNGYQMVEWLKKNRPCGCKPVGVQMYLSLLKYDLHTEVSGSNMPKFNKDDWPSVVTYAVTQAEAN